MLNTLNLKRYDSYCSGIASINIDKSSFDCSNVGANTVTLTVTDVNGNQSTATCTVTINDVTNPIAIAKKCDSESSWWYSEC